MRKNDLNHAGEVFIELRHQGQVSGRERTDADHVHIVLDRVPGCFRGSAEQGSDVHIKAHEGTEACPHVGAVKKIRA